MKQSGKKDLIPFAALIIGVVLIVSGIIFLFMSGMSHTGYGGGVSRASTSIAFGADFYTTSAQYAGLAANAMIDLYKVVTISIGIFFIAFGSLDILVTLAKTDTMNFTTLKKNGKSSPKSEGAPAFQSDTENRTKNTTDTETGGSL